MTSESSAPKRSAARLTDFEEIVLSSANFHFRRGGSKTYRLKTCLVGKYISVSANYSQWRRKTEIVRG